MNKFTMLFALIIAPISLNSMAFDNPCPGKICVDQIVLDSNNHIIKVDQVDGQKIKYYDKEKNSLSEKDRKSLYYDQVTPAVNERAD